MNNYLKICLFGFLLWLIPFVVSILIFPLRVSQRLLFESIMPVVVVIWTVFFSIMYLSGLKSNFQKAGAFIGLAWLFISIFLDLIFFLEGPMKMPLLDYAMDIGVTYLMIPFITSGFGYLLDHNVR
jgi:hypothetical protein